MAVLAVLQAGGALCAVDPGYPPERVHRMREHSAARFVLTGSDRAPELRTSTLRVLVLDSADSGVHALTPPGCRPAPAMTPADTAYVVFTSGSTGEPKAITVPHRALDNLVLWTLRSTSAEPLRTLMFAPLGFDVFLQEVVTTWCSGGCLYIPSDDCRHDLPCILDMLVDQRIERLFTAPVALCRLAELACEFGRFPTALREVAAAGEALHVTDRMREFFARIPGCRLHNHYGPAETHVALAHTLTGPPESWPDRPAIGLPGTGMEAHVRAPGNPHEQAGARGELWLSGTGLAHGYLGQKEHTAERFRSLRMGDRHVRMYRTGDLVEQRADGALASLGRADDQLKIRGYRVEPAEVEAVIPRHPAVRQCAVVSWAPTPGGETRLVAHVVSEPGHAVSYGSSRSGTCPTTCCRSTSSWLRRCRCPRTARSTAVGFRHCPLRCRIRADVAAAPRGSHDQDGVRTSVAEIWSAVLGTHVSTAQADFVEIGGTSLSFFHPE